VIRERVRDLLGKVADGSVPIDSALASLAQEPTESLGFATIDHHRALRQGFPEVVYGAGKTTEQLIAITQRIAERGDGVLATRVADDAVPALLAALPGAQQGLAERIGMTRVSVNRALRTLAREGLVRVGPSAVTVLAPELLVLRASGN